MLPLDDNYNCKTSIVKQKSFKYFEFKKYAIYQKPTKSRQQPSKIHSLWSAWLQEEQNRTDITPLLIQLHWLSELQQINFKLSLTFKALLCATYLPDLLQTYLPSCSLQSVSIDLVAASELWVLGPSSVMYWRSHSHTGLLNRKKNCPIILSFYTFVALFCLTFLMNNTTFNSVLSHAHYYCY